MKIESITLNNFMRYTKNEIRITVKNKKIILFNDGDSIDKNILNNMLNSNLFGRLDLTKS